MFNTLIFPIKDRRALFQKFNLFLTLYCCYIKFSFIVSSLPIHIPKHLTLLFFQSRLKGLSVLCFQLPNHNSSVFSTLIFAPVPLLYCPITLTISLMESSVVAKISVSSAYCSIFSSEPYILTPFIFSFFLIAIPKTSAISTYNKALGILDVSHVLYLSHQSSSH